MIGAIIGDIIGSIYEFSAGKMLSSDEFFKESSRFTDDSVMTVAIGYALFKAGKNADADTIKKYCIQYMHRLGKKYPNAGYGGRFVQWIENKETEPYGSFGNGSAMRVSAAGWLYDSLERTREVAAATASVTHNHPEGIKGAEAVASIIYLARTGASRSEIAEYVTKTFDYDITKSPDNIRKAYKHNTTCQGTVPEAIVAFLSGESFEDVIRIAVSFGGDTDTLTAIAGSMAEAKYGVPDWMIKEVDKRLTFRLRHMIRRVQRVYKSKPA